jgi:predicted ArsR family transcriptional regulator
MNKQETTVGFTVYELPTFQTTIKELAARIGVDDLAAQGFVKFLVAKGVARLITTRKTATGKGKPANVYEIPNELKLTLRAA